jgi:hypothetical protein
MRSNQQVKTVLVVTFALGVLVAPAALAHGGQSGWVVRADEQAAQLAQAAAAPPSSTWVVRPNPDQQAAELAQDATASPASSTPAVVRPNPDEQTPPGTPATIVRITNPSGGFAWGEAGIGVAGGVALSILGLGLILAFSHHRGRRSRRSAPIAS